MRRLAEGEHDGPGDVVGGEGAAAGDRACEDHVAAVSLPEVGEGGADGEGGAEDVGVDHRPPVLDALLEEAALGAEAGVGEVCVHAAEALERGGDESLLVVPVGDVAAYGDGGVSAAELLGESGQLVLGAGREDHAVAELDRPPGGGGADAGAGACDNQDGFVGHGGVLAGGLGPEPLDPPAATCIGQVAEAVVEAAGAVLPELPGIRDQAVAAPVLADGEGAALVLLRELSDTLFEPLAARAP